MRTTTTYLVTAVGVWPYSTQTPAVPVRTITVQTKSLRDRKTAHRRHVCLSVFAAVITNLEVNLSHQQRRYTWHAFTTFWTFVCWQRWVPSNVSAGLRAADCARGALATHSIARCAGGHFSTLRSCTVTSITVVSAILSSHPCHSLTVTVLHEGRRHVSTLPVTVT